MVNAGWLGSMWSGVFLQTKFTIFQGCPTKQAAFLPEQHGPYNQLLIQPLAFPKMLFCINSWSEGFEILSPFFSEYSFLWLQHFFLSSFGYLFELIFASETVSWVLYDLSENENIKPNIQNNIWHSSLHNGFSHLFSSTGFYFKSKVIEASHTRKNMSFNFGAFFSKCTFLRLSHFFLA